MIISTAIKANETVHMCSENLTALTFTYTMNVLKKTGNIYL
jgi:hypothetical protein